jgi:hypothetical protein
VGGAVVDEEEVGVGVMVRAEREKVV